MTSSLGPREYHVWGALFVVLANDRAIRELRRIVPDLPATDAATSVAKKFNRRAGVAQTNLQADQALAEALASLRMAVGQSSADRFHRVGLLLEPDTSGDAAAASAWINILRAWGSLPVEQPHLRTLSSQLAHVVQFRAGALAGLLTSRGWEVLIEFAQGRVVTTHIAAYLRSLDPGESAELLGAAEVTARSLRVPVDRLRAVVGLNGSKPAPTEQR